MRRAAVMTSMGFLAAVAGCSGAGSQVSYQGYGGTAIVSTDGRTVTVGQFGTSCPAKVMAVARESATRVALVLQLLTPDNPPPCLPSAAPIVPSQAIRLHAPLGSRKLVDGATGRATAWISARLVLRPAALPAGYRLTELIPAADISRAQSPGPRGCKQFYRSQRDANELEIVQSAGSVQIPGAGSGGWTRIRVRGYAGRASRNLITWRENGLTDYVLIGEQSPGGAQVLSTRQLIAIADSAPA